MAFLDETGLAELWRLIQEEDAALSEEIIAACPKIQTGSYAGSDTSGSSNKKTLTFSFQPKIVLINGNSSSTNWGFFIRSATTQDTNTGTPTVSWSDNSVSWYANNAQDHFNTSGVRYYYIAIG